MIESKLVKEVYEKLKDRKDIELTGTMAVENSGFTADFEAIHGKSSKGEFFLYSDDGSMFTFAVEYPDETGTHWHPWEVEDAVHDIIEFMEPDGRK